MPSGSSVLFIEGEKVRMPTERRTAGWHMYQGVVHTSLRLRSRIYNNSLGERLLFRAWNFPRSKQAVFVTKTPNEVIWFHESESKCTPVPGRGYALQKSSGGLNWCPSIHRPSTTEKISISLRPGLGLRSPIVERNYILFIGWPRQNITIVLGKFNRRYAQIFGPFATF